MPVRSIPPYRAVILLLVLFRLDPSSAAAVPGSDDGYRLWMGYRGSDSPGRAELRRLIRAAVVPGESRTSEVIREELRRGLRGILGEPVPVRASGGSVHALLCVTPPHFATAGLRHPPPGLAEAGEEGFVILTRKRGERSLIVAANGERGLLYGAFHLLRSLQLGRPVDSLACSSSPKFHFRLLDHWDNLDGSVERGYAGASLWKWAELPKRISPRYADYARAAASIGINGAVLNNVNADPAILTAESLAKVAVLADVFRPYGIRVFLSVNFASPLSGRFELEGNRKGGIGDLSTADPLDPHVRRWWKEKVEEVYRHIPDFGGFLVKASSEGMPGPQEFGRNHADGANMLAETLAPFHGIVMWRSFVYDPAIDPDRVKRAYKEFVPLDGTFAPNVFVQGKNGPLDFQPREPVQPLFGAMPHSSLMLELQITQEYLGHSTHLVYLAPMWKEVFRFDTYARGPSSSLASVLDGTLESRRMTGIAGVANTGDDRNWCGHLFAQANWYAFGRLAWDHTLSAEAIAEEWIRQTFGSDPAVAQTVKKMMMGSWEACVNYMTPLGLHHIMQPDLHYGPGPSHDTGRVDWRSTYYHRADGSGLGFDRTTGGSDAVSQYPSPLRERFNSPDHCPEKYLLWFHHVPWDRRMKSGRTLWEELCSRYEQGTGFVDTMLHGWSGLRPKIEPEIHAAVRKKLEKQRRDARLWKETCLEYFGQFSKRERTP